AAARPRRRHLRDRSAVGDDPGRLVPVVGEAPLLDGTVTPPLRDEGVVRDEDHGALLDRHGDPVCGRLRALLPVLPRVLSLAVKALVYGLGRTGEAVVQRLAEQGDETVQV